MWIRRKTLDKILGERDAEIANVRSFNAQAVGFREALLAQKSKDDVTIDWLTMRITQLEKERAVLMERVCGVVIETPVIRRQPISPIPQNVPVDALPIFDDMGDDQATKLGVGFNPDGTVRYA